MGDLSARNFGPLIAYVLPGFVVLWGLAYLSPTIAAWLNGAGVAGPSVGGFLYVFVASVGCGMTASAFRWTLLDRALHHTGIRKPYFNFAMIHERLQGFERIVADHYQYYQFYGNTFIALLVAYPLWRLHSNSGSLLTDAVCLCIEAVFVAGARDALRVFYRRASQLLGESECPDDERVRRRKAPRREKPSEGAPERREEDAGGGGE